MVSTGVLWFTDCELSVIGKRQWSNSNPTHFLFTRLNIFQFQNQCRSISQCLLVFQYRWSNISQCLSTRPFTFLRLVVQFPESNCSLVSLSFWSFSFFFDCVAIPSSSTRESTKAVSSRHSEGDQSTKTLPRPRLVVAFLSFSLSLSANPIRLIVRFSFEITSNHSPSSNLQRWVIEVQNWIPDQLRILYQFNACLLTRLLLFCFTEVYIKKPVEVPVP